MSAAMSPGSSEATPAFVAPPLLSPTSEYANLSPSEAAEAAEAKKDRKILDLEITNKSLLAINASLEVTKVKQTAEIRDLRRRIREGRMSLAPGPLGSALGLAPAQGGEEEEGEWFEDAEEGAEEDPELEAAHVRCKALIDRMVANARAAILSKYEPPKEGNKVLHPAEIAQLEEERRAKRLAEREAKGAGIDITSDARDRVGSEGPGTADTSFSVFSEMTDGADADADLSASGTGLGSQFSERSGTETEGDYSLRSVNYAEGEPDESVDDAPGLSARRAQISSVPDAGLLSPNSLRRPSPCSPKVPAYLDPGNDESSRISS